VASKGKGVALGVKISYWNQQREENEPNI